MKTILILLVCIFLSAMALAAFGKVADNNPEEAAVRETVQHYLHGLKYNDVDIL